VPIVGGMWKSTEKWMTIMPHLTSLSIIGHSGTGTTTRYWLVDFQLIVRILPSGCWFFWFRDCCKTSCSWTGKGSVTAPVNSCAVDGVSVLSPTVASGCDGGSKEIETLAGCLECLLWNIDFLLHE
jgi:hypothetical protein